ncbi:MAG TPA: hypothetical protein VNU22_12015 [Candidatus Acidoferrum sp.]|jgi:hypothetical protein|nr:hypothetical protein [Candidatus Acidoferrum sp.]
MRFFSGMTALVAVMLLVGGASTAPVAAQDYGVPAYTTWQPGWDAHQYDKHHVMLGTVASFAPYRLTVARRNGNVQTVDLKNGTVIYPTGATPTTGERVALVGYYSNGTFIANRVILHP